MEGSRLDRRSPVVILCGGRGHRMGEGAEDAPKPLVSIGGHPILWHVIQIYVAQGFSRFILALGHRGELIRRWASEEDWPAGLEVECVDTGEGTPTGGRVKLIGDGLGDGPFFVTYADGLADIDLGELASFHRSRGGLATVTVVRPRLPYGVADLDGDERVRGFHEKPRLDHWINGGFFCFDPGVLDYLDETSVLEREPLERLASDGQLRAFRHSGFWASMDTYKESVELNDLWAQGDPPWRIWGKAEASG